MNRLEKIICKTLIASSLLFSGCNNEESFSPNQSAIYSYNKNETAQIKGLNKKISELKDTYSNGKFLESLEKIKEALSMDPTNPEGNAYLLLNLWHLRPVYGLEGIEKGGPYDEQRIIQMLTLTVQKDVRNIFEEGLKESNFRMPVTRTIFTKTYSHSTFHDQIRWLLAGFYISPEEADKKGISLISHIKENPLVWSNYGKEEERFVDNKELRENLKKEGYIFNKREIILEGKVINFGKNILNTIRTSVSYKEIGGTTIPIETEEPYELELNRYFILRDKFGQEIEVVYKNKPSLGEHVKVKGRVGSVMYKRENGEEEVKTTFIECNIQK